MNEIIVSDLINLLNNTECRYSSFGSRRFSFNGVEDPTSYSMTELYATSLRYLQMDQTYNIDAGKDVLLRLRELDEQSRQVSLSLFQRIGHAICSFFGGNHVAEYDEEIVNLLSKKNGSATVSFSKETPRAQYAHFENFPFSDTCSEKRLQEFCDVLTNVLELCKVTGSTQQRYAYLQLHLKSMSASDPKVAKIQMAIDRYNDPSASLTEKEWWHSLKDQA